MPSPDEQITALADGRVVGVTGFYLAALGYVEHPIAHAEWAG